ncbi:MAG TPA: oligosaccharide flippase family protein [Candidatus Limnocylindrales bacterium]|nr:oligosaccharide flippase family protein [Candidatus Limnocylindrales bacterium]
MASSTDEPQDLRSVIDPDTAVDSGAGDDGDDPGRAANRKQIRGSSLLLVGRVIGLGLDFATQVLIVRYLSKTEYGAFALALSIVAIGTTICLLGLERTVGRFAPIYHEKGDLGRMWGTILVVVGTVIGMGLAVVLGVYVFQGLIGGFVSNELALAILLLMIVLAPLQALDSLLIALFASFGSARSIFFRRYVVAPVLQLSIVVALIATDSDVRTLALGYVFAAALGMIVYSFVLLRMLQKQGLLAELRRDTLRFPTREIFTFSVPLLTSDLAMVLRGSLTVVLIEVLSTTSEVAEFRAVLPLAIQNLFVATSFRFIFTPGAARHYARGDHVALNDLYWQTAAWIAILAFPLFALCVGFPEQLSVLLFGEQYRSSGLILGILCIGYYVNGAMGFNTLTLRVFNRVRFLAITDLSTAALNLVLALVLIQQFGALGAAIATSATFVLQNFIYQWGLKTQTWVAGLDARYVRPYASIIIGALVIIAIAQILRPPFLVGIVVVGAVSLLVFAINRHSLQIVDTYPELGRFRVMRRIFGDPSIT